MGKRKNEMFIGNEKINIEGRSIKHPALIKIYANVTTKNKLKIKPLEVIGLDIETDAKTSDMKLLGIYSDKINYRYYTKDFLQVLFQYIRYCKSNRISVSYWNKLDPFILFKLFLNELDDDNQKLRSLKHFGKISGEWNKKYSKWVIKPVIEIEIGNYKFGIMQSIRSSIQFFYYRKDFKELHTVWAYDIATLYIGNIEEEAKSRFSYYSKIDESAHIVDWKRFEIDNNYRDNIVLKSNYYDARAVHDLAYTIQEDFKNAFNFYPSTLISQGSFARTAIIAELYNELKDDYKDEKLLLKAVEKEVKSIGLIHFKDEWASKFGKEAYKDMESMFTEAYSGGYIEAIRYGFAKEGYYADIASAYPGVIQYLYDLRNAKIESGHGCPKPKPYSYVILRGTINIPANVNFHTITVKHWLNKDTNIRPTGIFKASYTYNERQFLIEQGATFSDEYYYMIITTGKLSPLARVCMNFIELRKRLKEEGSSSEHMAKIASNSLYGILFEAVDTYEEITKEKLIILEKFKDDSLKNILNEYRNKINFSNYESDLKYYYDNRYKNIKARWFNKNGVGPEDLKNELELKGVHLESLNPSDIIKEFLHLYNLDTIIKREEIQEVSDVVRAGYRAGDYWNPLYATIICSETRLTMAKGALAIEKAGGKPILLMTDAILWRGRAEMLPKELVREVKTLGYFEKPEKVNDIVCLGSGRYGFTNQKGKYLAKKRGLNITEISNDDKGKQVKHQFNWEEALKTMQKTGKTEIPVNVRTLISPGLICGNYAYQIRDLGRIVDEKKIVPAIVGKNKRYVDMDILDPFKLSTTLINTRSIYLDPHMFADFEISDHTLKYLRDEYMGMELKLKGEKKKQNFKRYYKKNHAKIRKSYKYKYHFLRDTGYNVKDARHLAGLSDDSLKEKLLADGIEVDKLL